MVVAHRARAKQLLTTDGANDRICHQGRTPNSGRKRDSLITAETSLIARFNSLESRKKFPSSMRRELARKKLISWPFLYPRGAAKVRIGEIPCIFPANNVEDRA